jgi:hypothetical protein
VTFSGGPEPSPEYVAVMLVRRDAQREAALRHVDNEGVQMCEAARLLRPGPVDGVSSNAYLESMLLHARALAEFLVLSRSRPSDIRRQDFAASGRPHLSRPSPDSQRTCPAHGSQRAERVVIANRRITRRRSSA